MSPQKYLRYLMLPSLFGTDRTKEILQVNPTILPQREEAKDVKISVHEYNAATIQEYGVETVAECLHCKDNDYISWINIDGLRKHDVETICTKYDIHP